MRPFFIQSTFNTPTIKFDPEKGLFLIEGRSIPEDPGILYEGMLAWVEEYFNNPAPLTNVEVKLEYVNSGSSKYLLEFFRILGRNHKSGHKCFVIWYHEEEDEAIQDLGEHYRITVEIPFEFRITKDDE